MEKNSLYVSIEFIYTVQEVTFFKESNHMTSWTSLKSEGGGWYINASIFGGKQCQKLANCNLQGQGKMYNNN